MTSLNFDSTQLSSMELYGLRLQKVVADFTDFDAITKKYVDEKVAQAKTELTAGASAALDTFKELEDYLTASGVANGLVDQIATLSASISAEASRASGAESALSTRVASLESDSTTGSAVSAVQSELDAVETGAGLDHNGSYVAEAGRNYISGATSLKEADALLDANLKTEETARIADVASLRNDLGVQDTNRDESVALEVATLNATISDNFSQMEQADESATTDRASIRSEFSIAVVDEKNRAEGKEAEISLNLVDEKTQRETEDSAINLRVDGESQARQAEDGALAGRIDDNDSKHIGHDTKHIEHEQAFSANTLRHEGHDNKQSEQDGEIQGLGERPYGGSGFDVSHQGKLEADRKYLYFSDKWRLHGSVDGSRLVFEYDKGDGVTADWKTAVPFISS